MPAAASSVERTRSVSSMRRRNRPLVARATSRQYSEVRTPPTCSEPVGEGAKRVRTGAMDSPFQWLPRPQGGDSTSS